MSNKFQTSEILAVIDGFGKLISDYTRREESVNKNYSAQKSTIKRDFEKHAQKIQEELELRIQETTLAFQKGKQRVEEKFSSRLRQVERASENRKQQLLKKLNSKESRAKIDIQKEFVTYDNLYRLKITEEKSKHDEFVKSLSEMKERLVAIEIITQIWHHLSRKDTERIDAAVEGFVPQNLGVSELRDDLRKRLDVIEQELLRLTTPASFRIFRKFRMLLIMLSVVAIHAIAFFIAVNYALPVSYLIGSLFSLFTLSFFLFVFYLNSVNHSKPLVIHINSLIAKSRKTYDFCVSTSKSGLDKKLGDFAEERDDYVKKIDSLWHPLDDTLSVMRIGQLDHIEKKKDHLLKRIKELYEPKLHEFNQGVSGHIENLKEEFRGRLKKLNEDYARKEASVREANESEWKELETSWRSETDEIRSDIISINQRAEALFPGWDNVVSWSEWMPRGDFTPSVQFARLHADITQLSAKMPADKRLPIPEPHEFHLPISLILPKNGSILLDTVPEERERAVKTLNNLMLRILTTLPPGKVNFTIFDPVGLGESFSSFMHLADYEETLINNCIWTEPRQMEERLAELNEHMRKVIQMYLRNEYDTITEYNQDSGEISERYHFLVIADFPVNFDETSMKRLLSMANSGSRCGVYSLIHWDRRHPLPDNFMLEELQKNSIHLNLKKEKVLFANTNLAGTKLILESPPNPDFMTPLLHKIGQKSVGSTKVEVPFNNVAPSPKNYWTCKTTSEIKVPIGRTGAKKLQYLSLGRGTLQHALVAGKTGSGKTTLFHVLITNLSLMYSPDEIEFYLIDFKKGVEFKPYASKQLPHARVIAIESDREFGLSVLERIDHELKKRGDIFRKLEVQDLAGYRKSAGENSEKIPRTLLLIDEFQELFVEDDRIAQNASLLLDRIVRQGRAFGIHVMLGSQTLGGAYTLARATLGQMAVRIALQCGESDSYLILDENNSGALMLSRPGEAIYNDASGLEEGNNPFQVVWLPNEERDRHLSIINGIAAEQAYNVTPPIVFEGNVPSDITKNKFIHKLMELPVPAMPPATGKIWLGEPNSIKEATEISFYNHSGNNLLFVGQYEESALAMMSIAVLGLSLQYPENNVQFILLDGSIPEENKISCFEQLHQILPNNVRNVKYREIPKVIDELAKEIETRQNSNTLETKSIYLVIYGLQRLQMLRDKEDFSFSMGDSTQGPSTSRQFNTIVTEGPPLGLHTLLWCDNLNNINRTFNRKLLSEFGMRVLFQMSAEDSSAFIDTPQAVKLGMHRALYYNEQRGTIEIFRPYAMPDKTWLQSVEKHFNKL